MSGRSGYVERNLVMADAPKSDADCIEGAYEDQVAALFRQFFISLTGQPNKEKEYAAAFTVGLNTLRRAKSLALAAVATPAPPTS